jgi:hypothetical protein
MEISKNFAKASVHMTGISPASIEETVSDHQILMINSTDYVIRKFQTRPEGSIVTLRSPIGRTCTSSDYDTCFNGGRYELMFTHDCPNWIQLKVWVTDSSGKWYTATYDRLDLNCDYGGTALHFIV